MTVVAPNGSHRQLSRVSGQSQCTVSPNMASSGSAPLVIAIPTTDQERSLGVVFLESPWRRERYMFVSTWSDELGAGGLAHPFPPFVPLVRRPFASSGAWFVVLRNIHFVLSWARWGPAVMTRFLTIRSTISTTLFCCWLQMPSLHLSYFLVFRTWTSLWWPWGAGLPWTCSQSLSMIGRVVLLSHVIAVLFQLRQAVLYLGRSFENVFEDQLCLRLLTRMCRRILCLFRGTRSEAAPWISWRVGCSGCSSCNVMEGTVIQPRVSSLLWALQLAPPAHRGCVRGSGVFLPQRSSENDFEDRWCLRLLTDYRARMCRRILCVFQWTRSEARLTLFHSLRG